MLGLACRATTAAAAIITITRVEPAVHQRAALMFAVKSLGKTAGLRHAPKVVTDGETPGGGRGVETAVAGSSRGCLALRGERRPAAGS
jgi:hypothetical protein